MVGIILFSLATLGPVDFMLVGEFWEMKFKHFKVAKFKNHWCNHYKTTFNRRQIVSTTCFLFLEPKYAF